MPPYSVVKGKLGGTYHGVVRDVMVCVDKGAGSLSISVRYDVLHTHCLQIPSEDGWT